MLDLDGDQQRQARRQVTPLDVEMAFRIRPRNTYLIAADKLSIVFGMRAWIAALHEVGLTPQENRDRMLHGTMAVLDSGVATSPRVPKLAETPGCETCKRRGRLAWATVVDHIVPISAGGPAIPTLDGLRSLCAPCALYPRPTTNSLKTSH